eukprot:735524-Pleurochrysis_carterae.AAC.1
MRHPQAGKIYITPGCNVYTGWCAALIPKDAHSCIGVFTQNDRGSSCEQADAQRSPRITRLVSISRRSATLLLNPNKA